MARADLLNILYSKEKSPLEFNFDSMWFVPMYNILPPHAIEKLYNIATSLRYASKIELKYDMVKEILEPLNFKKFHAGTNRVIYRHLECTDIVAKIAIDRVGMQDNPLEFNNQQYLKPFVTKTFEVSPCGTVGIAERVEPITSRAEFHSIGESVFDLITKNIVGEYVLEDIGTKFFRNWGLRKGFGPVLLDYPYMFKLDGNRLFCNREENMLTGELCGGEIDYDMGFNGLRCTKCGKIYQARDLQKYIEKNEINFKDEEMDNMKVEIRRGNKVIYSAGEINETSVPRRNDRNYNPNYNGEVSTIQSQIVGGRNCARNLVNVENEQRERVFQARGESIAKAHQSFEDNRRLNTMTDVNINHNITKNANGSEMSVPKVKYPITKEEYEVNPKLQDNSVEATVVCENKQEFDTRSPFMTPSPEYTDEEMGRYAKVMADALGADLSETTEESNSINESTDNKGEYTINDEVKEEKKDIASDDYINSKYGDLSNEDDDHFEKFSNKSRKIDISNF